MSNESFDIVKIQTLGPGWREEWGRLCAALIPPISDACFAANPGRSATDSDYFKATIAVSPFLQCCRNVLRRQGVSSYQSEIEDFSSYMLEKYQEKVNRGTLFDDFDPECGNAIQYLCSPRLLALYCHDFRRQKNAFYGLYPDSVHDQSDEGGSWEDTRPGNDAFYRLYLYSVHDQNDEGGSWEDTHAGNDEPPDQVAATRERQEKSRAIFAGLDSLVVQCPAGETVVRGQIGLQLYPRLSTVDTAMVAIHDYARTSVASNKNVTEDESDRVIRDQHDAAMEKWNRELDEITSRLWQSTRIVWATRQSLALKWNKTAARKYLHPLEASVISDLYGVSIEMAHTYRSRYMKRFPFIFSNYHDMLDELCGDNREED